MNDIEKLDFALRRYDTVLKYLATETQIYWSRSQLFLVANAAMLGFALKDFPGDAQEPTKKLVAQLLGAFTGICLCLLWRKGLRSGKIWMEHWKKALRRWEELAFSDVMLYREPPSHAVESSGVAGQAASLFLIIWSLVAAYLVISILIRLCGCQLR